MSLGTRIFSNHGYEDEYYSTLPKPCPLSSIVGPPSSIAYPVHQSYQTGDPSDFWFDRFCLVFKTLITTNGFTAPERALKARTMDLILVSPTSFTTKLKWGFIILIHTWICAAYKVESSYNKLGFRPNKYLLNFVLY